MAPRLRRSVRTPDHRVRVAASGRGARDKAYRYVKSSDTITPSARPATQVRSIYAEVLRQTALRVVHEVLEADRAGAVRTVVFNGYVNGTDPATGRRSAPASWPSRRPASGSWRSIWPGSTP